MVALQAVLGIKVALILLAVDPAAADSFELVKSTVSHASSLFVIALLAWLTAKYGLALWRPTPIRIAALTYLGIAGLATVFAVDPYVSLFGTARRFLGLTEIADDVLLLFASSIALTSPEGRRRFLVPVSTAIAIVGIYALGQRFGVDPLLGRENLGTQVFSTTGQPDILGGLFSIVTSVSVAAAVAASRRERRRERWVAVAVALLGALVVVAAGARGAILGIAGGLMAGLLLRPEIRVLWRSLRVTMRGALVALPLASLLALVFVVAKTTPGSVQERLYIWEASVSAVAHRPLLGVGPDGLHEVYTMFRPEGAVSSGLAEPAENSTHNAFLHVVTGTGALGLAAFIAVLWFALRDVHALTRRPEAAFSVVPVMAYLSQGLVDVNSISIEWTLWVPLGLLDGLMAPRPALEPTVQRAGKALGVAFGVTALIAAVAALPTFGARIDASRKFAASEALVRLGRPLDAVPLATGAIIADGRRAEYWSGLGTALAAVGNPSAAANAFDRATQLAPTQSLYWRNLALMQVQDASGEKDPLRAVDRALAVDPNDRISLDLGAKLSYNGGRFAEAAAYGSRLIRLNPATPDAYEAPIRALLKLQRWHDAIDVTQGALRHFDTPHLHVLLATALDAAGDQPAARIEVERALALAPNDPEAVELRKQLGSQ